MPGGGLETGEQLWQGAIREVKEETGIDTECIAILGFRHGNTFKISMEPVSKVYFCVLLKPLSTAIHTQEEEIQEVRWMPIEEFKNQTVGVFKDFITTYENSHPPYIDFDFKEEHNGTFYS